MLFLGLGVFWLCGFLRVCFIVVCLFVGLLFLACFAGWLDVFGGGGLGWFFGGGGFLL